VTCRWQGLFRTKPGASPEAPTHSARGQEFQGILRLAVHAQSKVKTGTLPAAAVVAFGIGRSESPENVFVPDYVLAGGFLASAPILLYGIATGQALFGALVALVVGVPPALYHARFGESVNPLSPDQSLAVGLLGTAGLLGYGISENLLVGAAAAAILGVTAVDYRRRRGGPLRRRTRTAAVVGCLGGGLLAFGALAVSGRSTEGLAVGGVLFSFGPFVAACAHLHSPQTITDTSASSRSSAMTTKPAMPTCAVVGRLVSRPSRTSWPNRRMPPNSRRSTTATRFRSSCRSTRAGMRLSLPMPKSPNSGGLSLPMAGVPRDDTKGVLTVASVREA
jgi:hypothetical protein